MASLGLASSYHALGSYFPKPAFIFQVYGTAADRRAYFPQWVERRAEASFPIAVLKYGSKVGLVCGTAYDARQLEADPLLAAEILDSLSCRFSGVPVALAGRLPAFLHRAGRGVPWPAVSGSLGTRFAMREIGLAAARRLGRAPDQLNAAVIGASGFTGSRVVRDYAGLFRSVVAVDPKRRVGFASELGVSTDCNALKDADFALLLTGCGDEIEPFIDALGPGTLLADDTHPCLSTEMIARLEARQIQVLKAVMRSRESMWIRPHMPRFSTDDVPGCLLEVLVVATVGSDVLSTDRGFASAARELGFLPHLDTHPTPI